MKLTKSEGYSGECEGGDVECQEEAVAVYICIGSIVDAFFCVPQFAAVVAYQRPLFRRARWAQAKLRNHSLMP
uniref:Uncharacterized protein n=1 Tax=Trichogramma kaykai TaxID=54128 RepID=A0ABD2X570_9HYME